MITLCVDEAAFTDPAVLTARTATASSFSSAIDPRDDFARAETERRVGVVDPIFCESGSPKNQEFGESKALILVGLKNFRVLKS